ncbi:MAG TPA: SUMF1/EgtB/PvdO family nonheme iron enzyme [Terriglobales bacterium]|nr:SUMF1/EgtB/PvdO family nonheme iron enzyme [Terriglobales bacterium]
MPSTAVMPPAVNPTRSSRRQQMARARALTDGLFLQVKPEALFERPIPERHRIIFYIGHLEAFDWNLIAKNGLGLSKVSDELDDLFAFGIDPPIGQLPQDQPSDWPRVEQARVYVERVREQLDRVIDDAPPEMLAMALEHRLMHAETFTYMLHNLPYQQRILPQQNIRSATSHNGNSQHVDSQHVDSQTQQTPKLEMIEVTGGTVTLGKKHGDGFGWDNEFEQHTREVGAFAMSRYKITNGQYLDFVKAGGPAPHYWRQRGHERQRDNERQHGNEQQPGNGWLYHGMHAEMPLPLDWPVYLTQQQAEAYARWMVKSLPTEEQFHRAAFAAPNEAANENSRNYPWGNALPDSHFGNSDFGNSNFGNFGSRNSDLVPVTATPAGDSAFGIAQLFGNGWEWTRTIFQPFPGFAPSPAYPGYSANFFDGEHFVLKGASCATPAALLRASFRNWFRKDYPYAYTTFRVVEN